MEKWLSIQSNLTRVLIEVISPSVFCSAHFKILSPISEDSIAEEAKSKSQEEGLELIEYLATAWINLPYSFLGNESSRSCFVKTFGFFVETTRIESQVNPDSSFSSLVSVKEHDVVCFFFHCSALTCIICLYPLPLSSY